MELIKKYGLIAAIALAAIAIGLISIKFCGNDNPIEEHCELIIEKTTGQDVDLSPDSPESK